MAIVMVMMIMEMVITMAIMVVVVMVMAMMLPMTMMHPCVQHASRMTHVESCQLCCRMCVASSCAIRFAYGTRCAVSSIRHRDGDDGDGDNDVEGNDDGEADANNDDDDHGVAIVDVAMADRCGNIVRANCDGFL